MGSINENDAIVAITSCFVSILGACNKCVIKWDMRFNQVSINSFLF